MNALSDMRIPRKETFVWKKIQGDIIAVEAGCTHYLNALGARICELINERNTVADISKIVMDAKLTGLSDAHELTVWIERYIDDLECLGLISFDTESLADD
jgi:hypothetical protein